MKTQAYNVCSVFLIFLILLFAGCGKDNIPQGKYSQDQMAAIPMTNRYELPTPSGGMVFSVDEETITADEIINPLEKNLAPFAQRLTETDFVDQAMPIIRKMVRDRAADLLLYKEARKDAPEGLEEMLDKAVEKETDRFIAMYGNDYAEAERQLKNMGMDWRSYRDFQRKLILTQSYLSNNLYEKKSFSHTELLDFYNKVKEQNFHRPGMVEFRLIDLSAEKLAPDQIQQGELPQDAMRRIADEVMTKIQNGENFESLVGQYSQGPLASMGGLWTKVTLGTGSLPKPYDVIEQKVPGAKEGQILGPIEADGHIFIVQIETYQKELTMPFEEVQPILENQLQMQYQMQQQDEKLASLIRRADLLEMERFSEFCAREAYRRWKQL